MNFCRRSFLGRLAAALGFLGLASARKAVASGRSWVGFEAEYAAWRKKLDGLAYVLTLTRERRVGPDGYTVHRMALRLTARPGVTLSQLSEAAASPVAWGYRRESQTMTCRDLYGLPQMDVEYIDREMVSSWPARS